ncbi:uncharacterized protein LOC124132137 isoform X2 [Haliotis rufescens]|uniref:uncharacterized protein LOC124132137 isoform X2 n=1 Tax=Haliotis rufescens TaxID=6454 RepID=UPI001EB07A74|nr:uncharacterized protein LOC124132137 isoform X2 [Haliotis rufescens]
MSCLTNTPNTAQMIRKVILAMAELDQSKRPWAAMMIIASWFVLSFVQDACLYYLMQTSGHLAGSNNHLYLPVVLSLVEIVLCVASLKLEYQQKENSYLETICVIVLTHLSGVFLANIWFQVPDLQLGIAGGLIEPITALVLIYICTGHSGNSVRAVSLCIISFGMITFTMSTSTLIKTDRTVLIKILFGVFVILRNISVNYLHEEKVHIVPRTNTTLSGIVGGMSVVVVGLSLYLDYVWLLPLALATITCVLHACVTYMTCALLLEKYSITTVCVLSAVLQFTEAQVPLTSTRPPFVIAILALVLLCGGVYAYTQETVGTGHTFQSRMSVSTNEMFTRIQFLLFSASIIGVVFYGLQPRVSQRDLQTLSSVGLDKLIRRLLSIDMPEEHEH